MKRLSKRQKEVLKTIGYVGILGAAIFAPNILKILKFSKANQRYQYKKIVQKLYNEKIIYLSGERIQLTKKGLGLLKMIQTKEISIKPKKKWNGIWHLVCYDIPENLKKERDCFRRKLIESGFCKIQLSLWVYPYDCKEEIAIISQNLRISPFVAYLNTKYLPRQKFLIRFFKLNKSK